MARPKGEPTKVVRLFVADADWLIGEAAANDVSVAVAFVAVRNGGRARRAVPLEADDDGRCHCASPTWSKAVSNLCTTCRRMR